MDKNVEGENLDLFKGVVLDIKNEYAIVLTDSGEYHRIKRKGSMSIGKKIYFFKEDIVNRVVKKNKVIYKLIAACIILSLIIAYQIPNYSTYAIVSVDINPSLDLRVNKNDIVIGIITFNEEAKEIVNNEMIGSEITIVLEAIINNAEKKA